MINGRITSEDRKRLRANWRSARLFMLALAYLLVGAPGFGGRRAEAQTQPSPQIAANGNVIKMPLKGKFSRGTGLALQVDTRWANNYGYRPIEFTFTSQTATTVDHSITVRLHGGWWTTRVGTMTVEEDIDLPAGSTSLETLVSFPQYRSALQYFWWEVWIDGVKDANLSLEATAAISTQGGMTQMRPDGVSMLIVGSNSRQLTAPPTLDFQVLSLRVKEFPARWRDYTSFDLVALTLDEFEQLAQENPSSLGALRQWVQTGGQVWVGDVGGEWEHLSKVAEEFGLRGAPPTDGSATDVTDSEPSDDIDEEPPQLGWQPRQLRWRRRGGPDSAGALATTFENLLTKERRATQDPTEIEQLRQNPEFIIVRPTPLEVGGMDASPQPAEGKGSGEQADPPRRFRFGPRDSREWFVDHALGVGYVRAFRGRWDPVTMSTLMTPIEDGQMVDLMDRMPPSMRTAFNTSRNWTRRHGLAPDQANPDFANLLVPGLGLAPVTEFRVLITLFVLLIGPFNYWVLKRLGRMHLLVLTVPLAAGLLTAALFAYAAISDGFGTAVRVRSYTTLDQRTGDSTCWARLSYYSGLAPSAGLTFPDDLVVYPIAPGWRDMRFDPDLGMAREALWEPGQDRFTRGWLASRTPTQYLTLRTRKSPHRIEFAETDDRLRATNELGTTIRYVAVIDGDGKIFSGKKIAAGARLFLQPTSRGAAIRDLRQLIMANQPEAPPALSSSGADFALLGMRSQPQYMGGQSDYSNQRLTGSVLEDSIGDLGGMNGLPPLQLGPNSYVAVTETGPEVSLGISDVEEQASFHVLVGEW